MFDRRRIEPEYLDHAPEEEARKNLADIVRLNERFGGHALIRGMLRRAANGAPFTLLDVGAASGDTAQLVRTSFPGSVVTSLDLHPVNLRAAPAPKVLADAFRLPFRANSFDFVFCSLFLHHFEDEQVVRLLKGFYRVARRAILVSDLERHVLPYLFLPATQPFLRWGKITVHDGMVSVRAAFRADELRTLCERAGIANAEIAVHRPAFRLSLIARKE